NVGKSAVFNQLTGVDQIIGNWPGKTVERAEGTLQHQGLKIKIIDLPGIYSFSTYSMEELVSRDFIALEKPDIVVNVVDASALERNLFFTIQLLELGAPVIIALNQIDLMEKKGISIDHEKLGEMLGVPVVPTVAIKGKGISELTEQIICLTKNRSAPLEIKYGREVEERIEKLTSLLGNVETGYPRRWIAIKLLERDGEVTKLIHGLDESIVQDAEALAKEIEEIHGEPSSVVMSAERYKIADEIARNVQMIRAEGDTLTDKLDRIALHPILGYLAIVAVIGGLLAWTFIIGATISQVLADAFSSIEQFEPVVSGTLADILWNGAFTGFVAGVTLVIPYVLPFYIILAVIEDSGYLTRISLMLDKGMHKMGLHGKAIIPLILGYGCNVPACFSCRIMETPKQKLLAAFLVTLVPCTARTVVILGLVAAFVNIWWTLALYVFDIALIIALGRIAFKVVPGESVGLIMEMPRYHIPSAKVVLKQTWARTKSLLWVVFPAYIAGSAALQAVYAAGWLNPVNDLLRPITVGWLGLPAAVGILLIFGVVRKELTILMLAIIFQTMDFASVMTPVQLIVLALVTMIYIPCLALILSLAREFGWKKASAISIFEVVFAISLGGIVFRLLSLVM
ncbi:MAG TPA: ferrous iron transport protein B, partial [Methanotrichaceae archaeon]|nr:ferrous iron transport protein B [Methanotrichaceae archaeon]